MSIWTVKQGSSAKYLILALRQDGELISFGSLDPPVEDPPVTAPQLRVRLRGDSTAPVSSYDVIAYVDPDLQYNAQVQFSEAQLEALTPGTYKIEVDAVFSGDPISFPDDGYELIKVLASLD